MHNFNTVFCLRRTAIKYRLVHLRLKPEAVVVEFLRKYVPCSFGWQCCQSAPGGFDVILPVDDPLTYARVPVPLGLGVLPLKRRAATVNVAVT